MQTVNLSKSTTILCLSHPDIEIKHKLWSLQGQGKPAVKCLHQYLVGEAAVH
ncbi:hypothetical protein NP493_600g04006 [Ridgeia piscesae]|uniref:Uncharacterized protein n=1 Tax=Ridgeia piscesae TaxID=27915 RepID=A0AAD9KVA6_RIDPI|nr:hypothetical protein NP493_600g04006 [Ridgeia piscesae]